MRKCSVHYRGLQQHARMSLFTWLHVCISGDLQADVDRVCGKQIRIKSLQSGGAHVNQPMARI